MKQIKIIMTVFVVLLGLTTSFAFKTAKHKFNGTVIGGSITLNGDGSVTINNAKNATGRTQGTDYTCDATSAKCTVQYTGTTPISGSSVTIPAGDWIDVSSGVFTNKHCPNL